jgi:hypothetical protein
MIFRLPARQRTLRQSRASFRKASAAGKSIARANLRFSLESGLETKPASLVLCAERGRCRLIDLRRK